MEESSRAHVEKLQERINHALREEPEDWQQSDFSEFATEPSSNLDERLYRAATGSGIDAVESALNEFDRLLLTEDRVRAQHALQIFLTHHPEAVKLGLRIPTLEERSPWKVRPSRRNNASE